MNATHITLATLALAALIGGCGSTEIREVPVADGPDAPAADRHVLSLGESNRVAGDVTVKTDAAALQITLTAVDGLTLAEARVCAGVSAFHWIAPESCAHAIAPNAGKGTISIPLEVLGAPAAGRVIFLQVAGRLLEDGADVGYAYAGTFKGRVAYTIPGREAEPGAACALSAADWAGEKAAWPAVSLVLGGVSYRADELQDLLARLDGGDASVMLAKQVIAARLNEAAGVVLPLGIADLLSAADLWFPANADGDGALPFEVVAAAGDAPNSDAFEFAVSGAEMLRQLNDGKLTAPTCP